MTPIQCSLLITLPIFDVKEDEAEIVDEICNNIKEKKHCIPEKEFEGIIMGMYLNIIEYIELKKQEKLLEKMIWLQELKE